MSRITITKIGSTLQIGGTIDEHADFSSLFSGAEGNVQIDFGEIERINSTGVREWVNVVKSRPDLKLTYLNCPTAVVEQMNMVPEFLGKYSEVISIYGRYYCEDCNNEQHFLLEPGNNLDISDPANIHAPEFTCTCGQTFEFDDDENEFFLFFTAKR